MGVDRRDGASVGSPNDIRRDPGACDGFTPVRSEWDTPTSGRRRACRADQGLEACKHLPSMCCCPENSFWSKKKNSCNKCDSSKVGDQIALEKECGRLIGSVDRADAGTSIKKCKYVQLLAPGQACWGSCSKWGWNSQKYCDKESDRLAERVSPAVDATVELYLCRHGNAAVPKGLHCAGRSIGRSRGLCLRKPAAFSLQQSVEMPVEL